ncbi:hypothetical protein MBOE_33390 [Mycolicibacterium boenickei]|uniref:Uncharacterized protein n=1 Tax=Mycolicibacterium boenickei TaxID=146017 RepID=A0ABM7IXV4_9MYCO|nr:hypothetical protein MBOE_33390 [Mycolicibacterium boenickei]
MCLLKCAAIFKIGRQSPPVTHGKPMATVKHPLRDRSKAIRDGAVMVGECLSVASERVAGPPLAPLSTPGSWIASGHDPPVEIGEPEKATGTKHCPVGIYTSDPADRREDRRSRGAF